MEKPPFDFAGSKPFVPSRVQGTPDLSRRDFFKAALGGAAVVVAAGANLNEMIKEDPTKESPRESILHLMNEMDIKKLDSVPRIETTANENIISGAGWVRLGKIMRENNISARNVDQELTLIELKELLDSK